MSWAPDYITVQEFKDFLDITGGDIVDDIELAVAITAASRTIDDYCNRQFGSVAVAEERLYTAWPDFQRGVWCVDVDDFMSTTNLVVEVDGTATADFTKEPVNAASKSMPWTRLTVNPTTASVSPTGADFEVSVTAIWGWSAVPTAVKQATMFQTNRFQKRRVSPFGVTGSPEQAGELRLLSRVDPDVAVSLRGYVRPRMVG